LVFYLLISQLIRLKSNFEGATPRLFHGRLLKEFESLYNLLHIAGYYRKLLDSVDIVKDALKATKAFIQHLGQGAGFIEKIS